MAGDAAARLRTFDELYAEIERLPSGATGEILEPGAIRVMSRPGRRHRHAERRVLGALRGVDENEGAHGWWIEVEPEVRLEERLVVPDLAGWRVDRVPELPEDNPIRIVPDWCCAILSPSTERDDRRIKLPLYAAAGVLHLWLVDPVRRLVEVYEPRGGKPAQIATAVDDDSARLPPFDGLELDLARLWLPARP